jgi:SAM-dependent methyltransferase
MSVERLSRRSALLALPLLLPPGVGRSQTADKRAWFEDFVTWAKTLPAENFNVRGRIEQLYRQKLAASGLPADRIDERWASILEQQRDSETWSTLALDKRFAAGWYEGTPPSKPLAEFLKGKQPGTALDCGMGAGRNSVLLATLGWDVTGIDISEVAVERAAALAKRNGVKIRPVRVSYRDFDWGTNRWDLIVNVDSWDGEGQTPSTFAAAPIRAALKPAGFLYIESHLRALTSSDRPLAKIFSGLQLLQYTRGTDADWQGANKEIVVFVARK